MTELEGKNSLLGTDLVYKTDQQQLIQGTVRQETPSMPHAKLYNCRHEKTYLGAVDSTFRFRIQDRESKNGSLQLEAVGNDSIMQKLSSDIPLNLAVFFHLMPLNSLSTPAKLQLKHPPISNYAS